MAMGWNSSQNIINIPLIAKLTEIARIFKGGETLDLLYIYERGSNRISLKQLVHRIRKSRIRMVSAHNIVSFCVKGLCISSVFAVYQCAVSLVRVIPIAPDEEFNGQVFKVL